MSQQSIGRLDALDHLGLGRSWRAGRWWLRLASHWELALVLVALVGAAITFWVTLRAGFLAHPGWLAVQKADFILGPIGVGLQNMRDRLGAVGGHVDVNSEPGEGTLVIASAPVRPPPTTPLAGPGHAFHAVAGIRTT